MQGSVSSHHQSAAGKAEAGPSQDRPAVRGTLNFVSVQWLSEYRLLDMCFVVCLQPSSNCQMMKGKLWRRESIRWSFPKAKKYCGCWTSSLQSINWQVVWSRGILTKRGPNFGHMFAMCTLLHRGKRSFFALVQNENSLVSCFSFRACSVHGCHHEPWHGTHHVQLHWLGPMRSTLAHVSVAHKQRGYICDDIHVDAEIISRWTHCVFVLQLYWRGRKHSDCLRRWN